MSKIYIVISSCGQYEDYHHWNEKAFLNKNDAIKYAKELDKLHSDKPAFITDEFEKILNDCEFELPDWEDFPGDDIKEKDKYFKWQEEQEQKQNKLLFEMMYQRGQFITQEMYDQYISWKDNEYNDYFDCKVEELELV